MFKLFVPFFIQEIILVLITLMSNLLLNLWHCCPAVTTGIAFASQIFLFFQNIEGGICFFASLFIAQHYGRGAIDDVQRDYYVLLKISLGIGFIFFVLVLAIPEQLLFFANNAESRMYAAEYLRWFSPMFLIIGPLMISYVMMKNTHLERICLFSSLGSLALVLIVEASSIFSLDPSHYNIVLKLAASSMVISRAVELVFVIIFIQKKCVVKFKLKELFKPDLTRFKSIAYYGTPIVIGKISWGVGVLFITVFTSLNLSGSITTAHSLMINYDNIVSCMSNAIAAVVGVLIGRELGANRIQKAKDHAADISRFLFYMGIVEMAFFILFLPIVMFTTAPDTLKEAGGFLWKVFVIRLIIMIPRSYNASYLNGFFSSGGDTTYIMLVEGICAWVTIVPLAYIGLHLNWDPLLIYALIQCEEIFKFPVNIWRYKQKKWAHNITQKSGIVFNE
ncbi:MAG: hypothetical protein MJ208_02555 [Bacilli bacterium]|nr:hypothetical protein [Bacilli bacterium]